MILTIRSESDLADKDRAKILETARTPHTLPALVFLGIDDRQHASSQGVPMAVDPLNPEGVPYFAVEATKDFEVAGGEWGDARNSANAMDGWTAGIFAQGRALIDWNVRNKVRTGCCSRCTAENSSALRVEIRLILFGQDGREAVRPAWVLSLAKNLASLYRVCTTLPIPGLIL